MPRPVTITDTTLRDGQQSLWATRMSTYEMLPVADHLAASGVHSVDVIGTASFDSAVRYLHEDPFERIRLLKERMPDTKLLGGHWGDSSWGFRRAPADVLALQLDLFIECGIGGLRFMNGLMDHKALVNSARRAKELGAEVIAPLVFSLSPVHTDELYERKAREYVELADADCIMIKDSGGLLTPERVGSLVDAVRRGAGDRKVSLHSHCMTGLAPRVYMTALEHGVDDLQCTISPLSDASALPSTQMTLRNLRTAGYEVDVDLAEIEAAGEFLSQLAESTGRPVGRPVEYDHWHYTHQIPGGMLTNLRDQLERANLIDRFDELLEEMARVRAEIGWPTIVTPYSQFIANQAILNLIHGERYHVVPDQMKMYVLGYYGDLLADPDPDVLDKIMGRGSSTIPETPEPVPPALPELRRLYPDADDYELVMRYLCPEKEVDETIKMRGVAKEITVGPRVGTRLSEVLGLLSEVASNSWSGEMVVENSGLRVRLRR